MATAQDLGALSGPQSVQGSVSPASPNYYYKFSLASQGFFSLYMNGLTGDADVQLLNSAGTVLAISQNSGTNAESIGQLLAAGTYYIRVFPYNGASTSYNLSLSLATVHSVGALSGTQTFQGSVGPSNPNDFYSFTLASQKTFNLLMNGLSADADVQLLNSAGAVIDSSQNSGTTPESINTVLAAGTYYVRVLPYLSASTSYSLSLTAS
jgi:hypothetical protein